jgi:multidrug efflux pump subunit AcrA (membrane-fusion protein)
MSKKIKKEVKKAIEEKKRDNDNIFKRFSFVRRLKDKASSFWGRVKSSSWKVKAITLIVIVGIGFLARYLINKSKEGKVSYETSVAEKGTLITSISGSGSITSGNYTNVTTKASGTVSKVYVTNGDAVTKGQKIADVTLDDYAGERQTAAWVSYLDAKENYLEAINTKAESDIAMWKARQDVLDAQDAVDDMNENDTNPATHETYTDGERMIITKTLDQTRKAFSVAEAKYLNSDADISNTSAKVTAALRDYQENSTTIIAPAGGTLTDLALAEGLFVSVSSTTSSTSGATIVNAQTVGKVSNPNGQLVATVNLTEVDITKVKANQKVTLTLDAYEDKSFTGKVLAVNTSGNTSSGVTNYPVTILLDPVSVDIYPNMAVGVEIITDIIPDVILVPSSAVQSNNGTSTVQIMKDGIPTTVEVEVGSSNDSQTEIVSGVNEGDEIVTSVIAASGTSTSNSTTSPFSGIGRSTTRTSGSSTSKNSGNVQVIQMGGPGF